MPGKSSVIRTVGKSTMRQGARLNLIRFGIKEHLQQAGRRDGTNKRQLVSNIHTNKQNTSDKEKLKHASAMKRRSNVGNPTKNKEGKENRRLKSKRTKNSSAGNGIKKRDREYTKGGAQIKHRIRKDVSKNGISTVRTNIVNTRSSGPKNKRNMKGAWMRPEGTGELKSKNCGRTMPGCNKNSKTS